MSKFVENDSKSKLIVEIESRKSHTLWCEKYRPIILDNFIGSENLKAKFAKYIKENDIPNLLLFGRPGTGKTSLAQILVKNIDCDSIYINASNENGIDTVRERISNFANSVGFKDLKIVILDEFDFFSQSASAALRNVIESTSKHTRFILTCNYIERVIEPIISRCQSHELIPPSKADVAKHLSKILAKENIKHELLDIKFLVDSMYPDIRRITNMTQSNSINGVLALDKKSIIESDYKLKVLEVLKDKTISKKDAFVLVRQLLSDNSISDFSDMYRLLYDNIDSYSKDKIAQIILLISEADYKSAFCVDKEINFVSLMIQILNEIK